MGETASPTNHHANKMNAHPVSSPRRRSASTRAAKLITALVAISSFGANAATTSTTLDDFSDPKRNNHGVERMIINDKEAGSQSHATQTCADGVMTIKGELVPGRGVPAFISVPLILSTDGKPQDLSAYQGVRVRVKPVKGILSVQVSSTEIDNFDYHTSPPLTGKRGEFQELRLPFKDMKRAWSEQKPLNLKSITSINLVSFGMAKDSFAYEVDEIGFY